MAPMTTVSFAAPIFRDYTAGESSVPPAFIVSTAPGGKGHDMKIRILYEDNIKNGHKVYTTVEVPDDDYSITLDLDYQQRLAEAKPEKKHEVKRCNTLQEMFDIMNDREYNQWRKANRHIGNYSGQDYEDDGTEDDGEKGGGWREPLMSEVSDDSIFCKDELERKRREDYEDWCDRIRAAMKPDYAEMIIAIVLDEMTVSEYAALIGEDANKVSHRYRRAVKKFKEIFPRTSF